MRMQIRHCTNKIIFMQKQIALDLSGANRVRSNRPEFFRKFFRFFFRRFRIKSDEHLLQLVIGTEIDALLNVDAAGPNQGRVQSKIIAS